MNIIAKKSLRIVNWLKSKLINHAIILGYHRITSAPDNPFFLNVSPENFSEQLEVIRKYAEPVSLQFLVKKLEEGKLSENYVAVTFDDGYADNFYNAKPLLEKYDIPATAFVSTGKLNSEFWWDELERLVLSVEAAQEELYLSYNGGSFFWQFNEKEKHNAKWSLFNSLYKRMHDLQESQIQEIIDQLKEFSGKDNTGGRRHRAMTIDELILLTSGSLINVGSHTVSHQNLKYADADHQRIEIEQSKRFLEETLGRPVFGFSYPNGSNTPESTDILKASGYSYACTSYTNYMFSSSDRFSLPRLWAPDLNGDNFEIWLRGWRN